MLEFIKYPDARLKQKAEIISNITDDIISLSHEMAEAMYEMRGVGLAAPQIGKSIRLFVMDSSGPEERTNLLVFINPKIELLGDIIVSEGEGCLSVPRDYRANVDRNQLVKLEFTDLKGNLNTLELSDYEAIIAQHEYDHLQGILFIDRISRLRRSLYDAKVKKWLKRKED